MDTALIAVLGTLLGAVVTHFFQARSTERAAALARDEQLRQERISTYSAFAGAVIEYRRSQNDRWFRTMDAGRHAPEAEESRFESYRLRTAARQALFRVQLVSDDLRARELADAAFEVTNCMHEARDGEDRARRSEQARQALEEFIEAAAPSVR
ncbi:hypothetical protein [Streptomyces purpureus]|uniref:Uncharacterized protein n=1 Tax=Streptomyces purpureus TaxID=1951 RepID=A0A918GYK8_9ACTN|nr:hypothetical protein [Streptomyces purpureus]GGT23972.1 hypothetical protein GCM10014713_16220 [Streptomyces purpureus]